MDKTFALMISLIFSRKCTKYTINKFHIIVRFLYFFFFFFVVYFFSNFKLIKILIVSVEIWENINKISLFIENGKKLRMKILCHNSKNCAHLILHLFRLKLLEYYIETKFAAFLLR